MEIKKTYESIEKHIHLVEEKFGKGSKLAEMFIKLHFKHTADNY